MFCSLNYPVIFSVKSESLWPASFLYAIKYLKNIGKLSHDTQTSVSASVLKFYTEIISQKTSRGWNLSEFSIKIESTAFVARFLSIANDWIEIDGSELIFALESLAGEQNIDGSFEGSNIEDKVKLTAFVVVSFLENSKYVNRFAKEIKKASRFIDDEFRNVDEIHTLAISAYALSFTCQECSKKFLEKLMAKSIQKIDRSFWKIDGDESKEIETAAYAILTHLTLAQPLEASKVLKFLNSKLNTQNGFFNSAFDTIIAYQAAAEAAHHLYSKSFDSTVTFTAGDQEAKKIHIGDSNKDQIQIVKLLGNKGVSMNAEGSGLAFVEAVRKFKVTRNDIKNGNEEDQAIHNACLEEVESRSKVWIVLGIAVLLVVVSIITGFTWFKVSSSTKQKKIVSFQNF